MCDIESKMADVTTAKAGGIQHAEEKCHRYKVGLTSKSRYYKVSWMFSEIVKVAYA